MEKLRNRIIFLIGLLIAATFFIWSHRTLYAVWQPSASLHLPLEVGPWTGVEQGVSQRVYEILEADTVLIRRYLKGDDEIWFAVVYYKDNQVGFHSPEACFGGLGNQVFNEGTLSFFIPKWNRTVRINQLRYKGSKGEKLLFYFYEVGDYVTDSYVKIRLKMLSDQLKFRRPGVALFELYSPIGISGIEQAKSNLQDFSSHLIPQLPPYLK